MNSSSAVASIRASAICGVISFVITTVAATIAAFSGNFDMGELQVSAWMFVDAVLIAFFTAGMFLKWRWCAIGMGVYFVFAKYQSFQTGFNAWGYAVGITMIYFYLNGLRGAIFLYREDLKLASQMKSSQPPTLGS